MHLPEPKISGIIRYYEIRIKDKDVTYKSKARV